MTLYVLDGPVSIIGKSSNYSLRYKGSLLGFGPLSLDIEGTVLGDTGPCPPDVGPGE